MEKRELEIGDVLQINPEIGHRWGGMLFVCDEPKSWGCQGYLLHTGHFEATRFKDIAFCRVKFEDMEFVGKLPWIRDVMKELKEACNET